MEEVFYFSAPGDCICAYSRDGTPSKIDTHQLWGAAGQFLNSICVSRHSIVSKNKIMSIYPIANDELLIFVADKPYPARVVYAFLRSQATMIASLRSNFMKPIHTNGMHLHNLFGAPRVYPRQIDTNANALLSELISASSSTRCALYAQDMIIMASDGYWQMSKRDIHALDLLVRHNEAPFTDQRFVHDTGETERALVFHVFKTMKFVCVNGSAFDALQAAAQLLPQVFHKYSDLVKQLEQAPPILEQQDGIVAWCVHDLATHRFFGDVPAEYEQRFIDMIAKCYDIEDEQVMPDAPGSAEKNKVKEATHINRVKDISFRLHDHMFFYMPQVLVLKTSVFVKDPNFWSFFLMHDLKKNVSEMRKFSRETMINMSPFMRPVNPVTPYINEIVQRINS